MYSYFTFHIVLETAPEIITQPNKLYKIPLSKSFDLKINYTGEEEPSTKWTLNEKEIINISNIETKRISKGWTHLIINECDVECEGNFKLYVKNNCGDDQTSFDLKVIRPPTVPGVVCVTNEDFDEYLLSLFWKKPEFDGGEPILGYLLEWDTGEG